MNIGEVLIYEKVSNNFNLIMVSEVYTENDLLKLKKIFEIYNNNNKNNYGHCCGLVELECGYCVFSIDSDNHSIDESDSHKLYAICYEKEFFPVLKNLYPIILANPKHFIQDVATIFYMKHDISLQIFHDLLDNFIQLNKEAMDMLFKTNKELYENIMQNNNTTKESFSDILLMKENKDNPVIAENQFENFDRKICENEQDLNYYQKASFPICNIIKFSRTLSADYYWILESDMLSKSDYEVLENIYRIYEKNRKNNCSEKHCGRIELTKCYCFFSCVQTNYTDNCNRTIYALDALCIDKQNKEIIKSISPIIVSEYINQNASIDLNAHSFLKKSNINCNISEFLKMKKSANSYSQNHYVGNYNNEKLENEFYGFDSKQIDSLLSNKDINVDIYELTANIHKEKSFISQTLTAEIEILKNNNIVFKTEKKIKKATDLQNVIEEILSSNGYYIKEIVIPQSKYIVIKTK